MDTIDYSGILLYTRRHMEEIVALQNGVLRKQALELQRMKERMLETMCRMVEFRNLESGDHIRRVKCFTNILASYVAKSCPEYQLDEEAVAAITAAAAFHDIGKIAIPDKILLKPGKLTEQEFETMKTHTTKGCEIIEMLRDMQGDRYGRVCYEICRYHHERYDGKGYPDGLKGEEIPIAAQIVSVADVYDALVSERCYKSAYTPAQAYDMIIHGACGQFSPKLLRCLACAREVFAAQAEGRREKITTG